MSIAHFVYQLRDIWIRITLMNNASVNATGHVQVFVWTHVLISHGHIPSSVIAGSFSNSA